MRERGLGSTHFAHPRLSQELGLGKGAHQSGTRLSGATKKKKYKRIRTLTAAEMTETIGCEVC